MACSKRAAIAALSFLIATIVLVTFLCTNSDFRSCLGLSDNSSSIPLNDQKTSGFGILTHRDAVHLPEEGGASPFFERHNVSGRLQPQRAYWEHLAGRHLRGRGRRKLASTQQVPINGTMESTGSYYVTMQLGTPPQDVTLLLDSGSALFWSECNDCPDCTGLHNVTAFQAGRSTSLTTPGCDYCQDYQYGFCSGASTVDDPSTEDYCFSVCSVNKRECFYGYSYADGSQTKGYIQNDVLQIQSRNGSPLTANVTFGCNKADGDGGTASASYYGLAGPPIFSPDISGIIGLSKGNYSVLNQLVKSGAVENKFGHCLGGVEGGGLFTLGADTREVPGMQFTALGSHPEWYNATIKSVQVGNQTLDIPDSVFYAEPESYSFNSEPDPLFLPDAIFDSGTSFTILPDAAYTVLTDSLIATVRYKAVYIDDYGYISSAPTPAPTSSRAKAPSSNRYSAPPPSYYYSSSSSSDWLCFAIPAREIDNAGNFDVSAFPTISFTFDGAILAVRPEDYLVSFEIEDGFFTTTIACPTFVSDQGEGATVIGEYSMRNHYFVFDSLSGLIGMAPTNCSTLL